MRSSQDVIGVNASLHRPSQLLSRGYMLKSNYFKEF